MWFDHKAEKWRLAGYKRIKVNGQIFTIRKINPLLDFKSDSMPQIFTSFISRRKVEPHTDPAKAQADMMNVIEAGLVEPELVPIGIGESRGKEAGITVEDIFRDEQTGIKLYWEIIQHSLLRFRGIKELFFWLLIKRLRLGDLANFTRRLRLKLHFPTEAIQ